MVITAAILALIAIPVLLLGLRGRVVDDHPICAKCKFDLVGLYPDKEFCPECGVCLENVGMVTFGTRKRRLTLIKVGVATLVPSIVILSAAATLAVMGRDAAYYKPTSMLTAELGSRSVATADAAARELQRRFEDKAIAKSKVASIIEAAIDRQADWDKEWPLDIGAMVEYAASNGIATKDQHARYVTQAVREWEFQVPGRLFPGEQIYDAKAITAKREAGWLGVRLSEHNYTFYSFELEHATIDGKAVDLLEVDHSTSRNDPDRYIPMLGLAARGTSGGGSSTLGGIERSLPPLDYSPGAHELVARFRVVVRSFDGPDIRSDRHLDD